MMQRLTPPDRLEVKIKYTSDRSAVVTQSLFIRGLDRGFKLQMQCSRNFALLVLFLAA